MTAGDDGGVAGDVEADDDTGNVAAGVADDVRSVELVARSRAAEARQALAAVAGYLNAGGSVSDVAVVAPDLATYEAPLTDAAAEYDLPTAVWTQLPLTDTLPYRLVAALCRVLDDEPCTAAELLAPVEYEWVPPAEDAGEGDDTGPLDAVECAAVRSALLGGADPDAERPAAAWCERAGSAETPPLVDAYVNWLGNHRHDGAPSGRNVADAFHPLLDAYEERALPRREEQDDPDLTRTARTARALVRTRDLVDEVREKYEDRVASSDGNSVAGSDGNSVASDDSHVADGESPSWALVARLAETIGGLRAGRREHANARALDVVDANDAWAMTREVVVAVGLRQGGWIERPEGALPPELRDRLLGASGEGSSLGFRAAWSEDRVRDHFHDTVAAASETLVCTRPRLDEDGTEVPRSPLLATVDVEPPAPTEVFADA